MLLPANKLLLDNGNPIKIAIAAVSINFVDVFISVIFNLNTKITHFFYFPTFLCIFSLPIIYPTTPPIMAVINTLAAMSNTTPVMSLYHMEVKYNIKSTEIVKISPKSTLLVNPLIKSLMPFHDQINEILNP